MRTYCLLLIICCGALGCSRMVYQPMSGLHRPVAIDTQLGNFRSTAISLRCSADKWLNESDVRTTCRRLKRLFERQGAQVKISTAFDKPDRDAAIEEVSAEDAPRRPGGVQLFVELKAQRLHTQSALPFFWDSDSDFTFAHDVTIRDETGFLLIRDRLTGRFIRRLAWPWQDDEAVAFSTDFYNQLSQLTFNARMRWTVTQPPSLPSPPPPRPARTPREQPEAPKPKRAPTPTLGAQGEGG